MPEQPTAAQLPAAPAEWQQILNTAYALVDGDKRDAIGEQICEAYSFGVATGVQRADAALANALTADLRRLRAELATERREHGITDTALRQAVAALDEAKGTIRKLTASVPGSSRRAPEPDDAAIRVDERADIARQLELLAADEALIADWVTTCDPIPLTVPDWLRALAGKIRAGDPELECRDLYPDRPITGAPLCPKGCGIPIWRHAVIPVAGESQASEPAPAAPKLAQGGIIRPVDLVDRIRP